MAALYRNREASFTSLRDGLALTDGNLGSHAQRLEEAGYVASRRALAGLSFEVRYRITPAGSVAYRAYVDALRAIIETPGGDAGLAVPPFPDATRPPTSVKADSR